MTERQELGTDPVMDRLNLRPVPVRPQFAIAADVIEAASRWRLLGDPPHLRCVKCRQSVATAHSLTVAELSLTVLAHLMQAHGWTRETVTDG